MLLELDEISKNSAERQMHALLSRMLARGDTERKDVIGRTKSIIEGMSNSNFPSSFKIFISNAIKLELLK